ncbi:unnamed protein product [Linum trigynum]|uniref:Uncharacterized protein n=1 Tax=Linum trigynum TaxID=586398 RepID=A0AAV2DXK9_9ROSI
MGLNGRVEDETELEAIKEVVREHSDALAQLEDGLARVQVESKADADDLRQRLEDLMRAVASLQEKKIGAGGTPSPAELAVGGGSALGGAIGGAGGGGRRPGRGDGGGGDGAGGANCGRVRAGNGRRRSRGRPSACRVRGGPGSVTDIYGPRDCGPKREG